MDINNLAISYDQVSEYFKEIKQTPNTQKLLTLINAVLSSSTTPNEPTTSDTTTISFRARLDRVQKSLATPVKNLGDYIINNPTLSLGEYQGALTVLNAVNESLYNDALKKTSIPNDDLFDNSSYGDLNVKNNPFSVFSDDEFKQKLKNLNKEKIDVRCFVSYARGTGDDNKIRQIVNDLTLAGVRVIFDETEPKCIGQSISNLAAKIRFSHFVLVFGSEKFKEKCTSSTNAHLKLELEYILEKFNSTPDRILRICFKDVFIPSIFPIGLDTKNHLYNKVTPESYQEKLIGLLKTIYFGLFNKKELIEGYFNSSSSVPRNVTQQLKNKYKTYSFLPGYTATHENFNHRLEHLYIDIEFENERNPLRSIQEGKKSLIIGDAGTGKTTFCKKLSLDWALYSSDKFHSIYPELTHIEHIIYLPLRELLSQEGKPLLTDALKKMFEFQITPFPEKSLIILDGYDEISTQCHTRPHLRSWISELLKGETLLTSRKLNSYPLDIIQIEISHLSSNLKSKYIERFFDSNSTKVLGQDLKRAIAFSDNLTQVSNSPLCLDMLCKLYIATHSLAELNTSTTLLYERMILMLINHYHIKNGHPQQLYFFSHVREAYPKEIETLMLVAWESIKTNQAVITPKLIESSIKQFSYKEIEIIVKLSFLEFGILRTVFHSTKSILNSRFEFSHMNYQYFFAALHAAREFSKDSNQTYFNDTFKILVTKNLFFTFLARILKEEYPKKLPLFIEKLLNLESLKMTFRVACIAQCFEEVSDCFNTEQREKFISMLTSIAVDPDFIKNSYLFKRCENSLKLISNIYEKIVPLEDQFSSFEFISEKTLLKRYSDRIVVSYLEKFPSDKNSIILKAIEEWQVNQLMRTSLDKKDYYIELINKVIDNENYIDFIHIIKSQHKFPEESSELITNFIFGLIAIGYLPQIQALFKDSEHIKNMLQNHKAVSCLNKSFIPFLDLNFTPTSLTSSIDEKLNGNITTYLESFFSRERSEQEIYCIDKLRDLKNNGNESRLTVKQLISDQLKTDITTSQMIVEIVKKVTLNPFYFFENFLASLGIRTSSGVISLLSHFPEKIGTIVKVEDFNKDFATTFWKLPTAQEVFEKVFSEAHEIRDVLIRDINACTLDICKWSNLTLKAVKGARSVNHFIHLENTKRTLDFENDFSKVVCQMTKLDWSEKTTNSKELFNYLFSRSKVGFIGEEEKNYLINDKNLIHVKSVLSQISIPFLEEEKKRYSSNLFIITLLDEVISNHSFHF